MPRLDKVDAELHLAGSKLHLQPLCADLAGAGGLLRLGFAGMRLLESRFHGALSDEDVVAAPRSWRCRRVANVERYAELGDARYIELVLCVCTCPQRLFRRAGDRIDEDLLLVEVYQGVREVFGRVATVDRGRRINAACGRLRSARVGAGDGVSRRRIGPHGASNGEATALGERALMVVRAVELCFRAWR